MMGIKNTIDKQQIEMFSLDQLVPENHLVRKIDKAIDLRFVRKLVANLYAPNGAESIDPVVLIKLNIIQYTFGIRSMRQTIREIEVNNAYRWYIGYALSEKIPHFSTFSKNYQRRFAGTDIFEQIFMKVIEEIIKHNFIDEESIFIDGTHIKANANNKKHRNTIVQKSVKFYEKELQKEIEKEREEHGKKPLKDKNDDDCPPPTKNKKESTTDPESGLFHKGEHKKVFEYTANTACDKHNYILGFEVAPGNRNDSTIFPSLYTKLKGKYGNIKNIVVDAGYKTPAIAKMIIDDGKVPIMPYKRPMTKKGFFKKYDYVYDELYDCYICPNDQILEYSTTNREGYKEYKSKSYKCKSCEYISQCTESKNHTKIIARHVWEEYIEQVEDIRHTRGSKEIYAQRGQTIERVFADAKELHGMRFARHRGLDKFTMELNLLFTCMNLKKLANRLWRNSLSLNINTHLLHFFNLFCLYMLNFKTAFRELLFPKGCLSSV
jgi:transposase